MVLGGVDTALAYVDETEIILPDGRSCDGGVVPAVPWASPHVRFSMAAIDDTVYLCGGIPALGGGGSGGGASRANT